MQTPQIFEDENTAWPPRYFEIFQWRQRQLLRFRDDPSLLAGAIEYYKTRPIEFICHWLDTYDPRNAGKGLTRMPFVLFKRQREFVQFLMECLQDEENGLAEKCRDIGATWVCVSFAVWLWRFWPGAAVGFGSRKEQLVDRLGDPDSIFEKLRMQINGMPQAFKPQGFNPKEHMSYMRIVNPLNSATITGEAGDNIGRGGRKLLYFKDESAHYVRPLLIEAALGDNTRVQIDISSVNGIGNPFHNRRESGIDWAPGLKIEQGKTRVFVFDWSDHPAKTREWYDRRKAEAEAMGLQAIFAQEVDRSYSASVEGVVIRGEWIEAAVDAHIALGFEPEGPWIYGFDVADEGGDTNALIGVRGSVILSACEWGGLDVGQSTRKVVDLVNEDSEVQYDSNGLGAGAKAEYNRLVEEKLVNPNRMTFTPWSASGKLKDPEGHLVPKDKKSPKIKDFFANYKAQAWWMVAQRFYNTYRMINDPSVTFPPEELVSISSDIPGYRKLIKELSQPTRTKNSQLKVIIDKKPDGTKSPNLADGAVQALFPVVKPKRGLF